MEKITAMSVFGTRPEAIKMAPLVKELTKRKEFESIVTITAQHREMLDQVLNAFKIVPDFDLNVMEHSQSLTQITSRVLNGMNDVIERVSPDIVLVHGDTSTTFAASLAAFYNQKVVGHVEAGLRTWNKYSPYPEEMNRQLTGILADLHFVPTERAKNNLLKENKSNHHIFITGNTAIDALQTTVRDDYSHPLLHEIGNQRIVLVTAHRRENIGENMLQMFKAIKRLVNAYDDIQVVFPVHLNPIVRKIADQVLGSDQRIHLISPLNVIDFHNFMARSYLILTDSGGIQEEAPSLGIPVLVMRDTTERPEGIEAGTLKLVGSNEEEIFRQSSHLLSDERAYEQMAKAVNPFGDGKASQRIADQIVSYFNNND